MNIAIRYSYFSALFDKTSEKWALIRQNFLREGILTVLIDRNTYVMTFLNRQNFRKMGSYSTKFPARGYSYGSY